MSRYSFSGNLLHKTMMTHFPQKNLNFPQNDTQADWSSGCEVMVKTWATGKTFCSSETSTYPLWGKKMEIIDL